MIKYLAWISVHLQVVDCQELVDAQEAPAGDGIEKELEEVLGVSEGYHAAVLQLWWRRDCRRKQCPQTYAR